MVLGKFMADMKTTILYDGITYTQTFVEGKFRFMVSTDGLRKISLKQIMIDQSKLSAMCSGCGAHVNTSYKSRFIHTPYLCHRCSITGERNPFYGKTHSDKTKKLQSDAKNGKYDGEKNPMFGKSWKDVVREKMGTHRFEEYLSDRNKKHSERMMGEKNPFYGKTHPQDIMSIISNANKIYSSNPIVKQRQREFAIERMRKNKYKMTNPERVMKSILSELSIPSHYNFIMDKRYQYDFRITNTNIIIEVQGDYWHCNPKIYPNGPTSERQKFKLQRDTEKKHYAEQKGYSILYVWEDELKNDVQLVKEKVMYEIQTKENRKD